MGQSVDAYVAFGFAVQSDGTPEEIEEFIDKYGRNCGLGDLLDVDYSCWGDDTQPPVIYVKSTQVWAMDGVPKTFEPNKLRAKTPDEVEQVYEAHARIKELIEGSPDYDERWGAKVGEVGWIVWGSFG